MTGALNRGGSLVAREQLEKADYDVRHEKKGNEDESVLHGIKQNVEHELH